jgi:heme-degrading monooxygenase HmoA
VASQTLEHPPSTLLHPPADRLTASAGEPSKPASASQLLTCEQTTLVVLIRYAPAKRWWGASRLVIGPRAWRNLPGLQFVKVLGSGHDAGFGVRPSLLHQGLFMVFDSAASAHHCLAQDSRFATLRANTDEMLTCLLQAHSVRGRWSGTSFESVSRSNPRDGMPDSVEVSITRASIRPTQAAQFWRRAPAAQQSLESAPGCLVAAGLGEAPLLRQMTFSIWRNAQAMHDFARSGAHQTAIEAAYAKHYFSESMFARYRLMDISGSWRGQRHG